MTFPSILLRRAAVGYFRFLVSHFTNSVIPPGYWGSSWTIRRVSGSSSFWFIGSSFSSSRSSSSSISSGVNFTTSSIFGGISVRLSTLLSFSACSSCLVFFSAAEIMSRWSFSFRFRSIVISSSKSSKSSFPPPICTSSTSMKRSPIMTNAPRNIHGRKCSISALCDFFTSTIK